MSRTENQDRSGYRISPVQDQLVRALERIDEGERVEFLSRVVFDVDLMNDQTGSVAKLPTADSLRASLARIVERYEILRSTYRTSAGRRFPLQVPAMGPVLDSSFPTVAGLQIDVEPVDSTDGSSTGSLRITLSAPAMSADAQTLILVASEMLRDTIGERGVPDGDILQYSQYSTWSRQFVDEPEQEGHDFWQRIISRPVPEPWVSWRSRSGPLDVRELRLGEKCDVLLHQAAALFELPLEDAPILLWAAFVARIGRGDEQVLLVDLDGRLFEEVQEVVGPVARTVPLIFSEGPTGKSAPPVTDWVSEMATYLSEAREYSDFFPFSDDPVNQHGEGRDPRWRIPEIGVEVIDGRLFTRGRLKSASSVRERTTVKLSSLIHSGDAQEKITSSLLYDDSRLDDHSAGVIASMFETFLSNLLDGSERRLDQIEVDADTRGQDPPAPRIGADAENDVPDLIEAIDVAAAFDLDAVVIREGDVKYSRRDLEKRVAAIAGELHAHGVAEGSIVPIVAHRSFDTVATILAILRTGAAFVPVDPTYPETRRRFLLDDCGAETVVTDDPERDAPLVAGRNVVSLKEIRSTVEDFPAVPVSAESPAYLIYTSGSTGTPKGCVISRRNISFYVDWATGYYHEQTGASGNWPLFTSLSFDLTLTSVFCSLAHGGCLHILQESMEMGEMLEAIFSPDSAIDIVKLTPAQASLLAGIDVPRTNVRGVILGGEALRVSDVETLRRLNGDIGVFNEYGPTETTIGCTVAQVGAGEAITIGRPIPGAQLLLLDDDEEPVPPYSIGEIWIGGPGTGLGYFGRDELTSERFRSDLVPSTTSRFYRTGDIAWRYPDGTLCYVGRRDDQVKVRGYRVEPGEVAAEIARTTGVSGVAVAPWTSPAGEVELTAWVVPDERATQGSRSLSEMVKVRLAEILPAWMVPTYIVEVEELPMTAHGKVDRDALPAPTAHHASTSSESPLSGTEMRLASIWERVLGLTSIGREDDFFELGGHSLLAMRMMAQLNLEFGRQLRISRLFEHPTLRALASEIDGEDEVVHENEDSSNNTATEFDLSDAQRRLWVLEQMEDLGSTYHIYGLFDIDGEFEQSLFAETIRTLLVRHPALRTGFVVKNGKPRQVIHEVEENPVSFIDLRVVPEDDRESEAKRIAEEILEAPFDLSGPSLFRAAVLQLGTTEYRLLVSMHHLVSDGWSIGIIIREIVEIYQAGIEGRSPELPEQTRGYADHVARQRSVIDGERGSELRAFWLDELEGSSMLDLPADRPRPHHRTWRGRVAELSFDRHHVQRLEALGRQEEASLFMVLVALLELLFYRYTGQEDITIGTAIAGRDDVGLEHQVGFFINLLPLRTHVRPAEDFTHLLRDVRRVALRAYDHQEYPFDRLVDELGIERDIGRTPMFDTFVVLQDPDTPDLRLGETHLKPHAWENRTNAYDLTFNFERQNGELQLLLGYNDEIYQSERIEAMLGHFSRIVELCVTTEYTESSLAELPIFTREPTSQDRLESKVRESDDRDLVTIFESFASEVPAREALVGDGVSLSYDQVRRTTNGIAARLIEETKVQSGEGTSPTVVVFLPRSPEIYLLFLAARKAGAVYVPIDMDFPAERIRHMIEVSSADLVITNRANAGQLRMLSGVRRVIVLEDIIHLTSDVLPPVERAVDDVVSIIFTSGTTGLPKGVKMYERGILNGAGATYALIRDIDPVARTLQFASPSFDASLFTMVFSMAHGGTNIIIDRETIDDPSRFIAFLSNHQVTMAIISPSYLATLERRNLPSLRCLMTVGESPNPEDALYYAQQLRYLNGYGPAECSICFSMYVVDKNDTYASGLPIGPEIPNVTGLVVDRNGQVLPDGVDGELWIGGIGPGPGYVDADQTRGAFVEHPDYPGERFYRTGDFVRRGFDDNFYFRGRVDNQVKIRGHRVEPEEAAALLRRHPSISDATVLPWTSDKNATTLVGWVILRDDAGAHLDVGGIRTWLADRLPGYMIPTYFFETDTFPLSPTGKVNHGRLLEQTDEIVREMEARSSDRAPATIEEKALCSAVAELLGRGAVSPDDNFFVLGGDSIKAIQLTWRLRERGFNLEVRDIFAYPILADASTMLTQFVEPTDVEAEAGEIPLHPIQSWFFERTTPETMHRFNQSILLRSNRESVDLEQLEAALEELVERHPMLRTGFEVDFNDGVGLERPSVRQIVYEKGKVLVDSVEIPGVEERAGLLSPEFVETLRENHRAIDVARPPLLRVRVIRQREGEERRVYLHLVAHHLVVDIVSWHVIISHIVRCLGALDRRSVEQSGPVPGYGSWVRKLTEFVRSEEGRRAVAYWRGIEPVDERLSRLPVDSTASNKTGGVDTVTFALPTDVTSSLIGEVHTRFNTDVRDLLVASLGRALVDTFGGSDVLLALEGHGRRVPGIERPDVGGTVGWFTFLFPLFLKESSGKEVDRIRSIKSAKEQLRSLPLEGAGYPLGRYLLPADERLDDRLENSAQVALNYFGVEDSPGEDQFFEVVREPAGLGVHPETERSFEVEILAGISDGHLAVRIEYVPTRLGTVEATRLAAAWEEELRLMIRELSAVENGELTPSDIDYDGLTLDELDDLITQVSSGDDR